MAYDNTKVDYAGDIMLFQMSGTTQIPLAFSTSANLTVSMKTRDMSSKDAGEWTEKAGGKFDWSATSEGLMSYGVSGSTGVDVLFTRMIAKSGVTMAFAHKTGTSPTWTVDATKKTYTGTVFINSLKLSAGDGESATYSISMEGSGPLTLA